MTPALAERLAAWFDALRWEAVPPAQQRLAQLRVLDSLGLIAAGSTTEAAAIARNHVAATMRPGAAAVAGSPAGAPPSGAALVHGVAAHALDFDDTFSDSVVHPGSAVVPAALAVGEANGASGAEVLAAIAGGYELVARLGAAGGKRFHARGFHASGVFAPIAAAFVAARLQRLAPATAASAVGLAASMAGGLMAFLPDGAWSKWLHLGWGNHAGITASALAADGFRGPAGALDGPDNLFAAFIGLAPDALASVEDELGTRWAGERATFKRYPCAHVIQGYIDLALALARERGLGAAQIAQVECAVAPWAVPIVCEPLAEKRRPRTSLQAIASLPHHVASAFVDGRVDVATIDETRLGRAEIVAFAERVGYRIDPALQNFEARLTVTSASDETFDAAGDAAPNAEAALRAKFRGLAARTMAPGDAAAAEDAVAMLPGASDVGGIGRALRAIRPGGA